MDQDRYLPLFKEDGNWIERPDLYLLARMGAPDKVKASEVWQIYETMVRADATTTTLNDFETLILKRFLDRDPKPRLYASYVVQALVAIQQSTDKPSSAKQAYRLVAHKIHEDEKTASIEQLTETVRKGFAKFRDTAHLQAAAFSAGSSLSDIEISPVETSVFLGKARSYQNFLDTSVVRPGFKWSPWRVPEKGIPELSIVTGNLTDEELGIALGP